MDVLGGAATAGTCTQDATIDTFDLAATAWTNPDFESSPESLSFNAGPDTGQLAMLNTVLTGRFSTDGQQITDSTMDGMLHLGDLAGVGCFILTCLACPDTGDVECVDFTFDSAVWNATGGTMTSVPAR